ncbi:MAG: hypothetical protein JWM11_7449 [Planctomycetaceae bacterium]|nr:hypothetical protein [Planctomycetaceae bacterium]
MFRRSRRRAANIQLKYDDRIVADFVRIWAYGSGPYQVTRSKSHVHRYRGLICDGQIATAEGDHPTRQHLTIVDAADRSCGLIESHRSSTMSAGRDR